VERGVLNSQPADDYAAANLGQLKHIASRAAAEMNARLPSGAGTEINALVAQWQAAPAPGVVRDDFAALNLGQLKAVAKPFYDRLFSAGYPVGYPWAGQSPDDYALAISARSNTSFPSTPNSTPVATPEAPARARDGRRALVRAAPRHPLRQHHPASHLQEFCEELHSHDQ